MFGEGYLRRKATRGIGRTNPTMNPRGGMPHIPRSLNPWRWFNGEDDDIEDTGFVIIDEAGIWPIPEDYRDMGIREGWLRLSGHYRNEHNMLILTYVLTDEG